MEGLLKKNPEDRLSSESILNHPFLVNVTEDL
jgi:hypothetical protein